MAKKQVEVQPAPDPRYHQFRKEVIGILVLALAIFLFFTNNVAATGIIGHLFFGSFLNFFIGNGKAILPFFIAVTGLVLLFGAGYTREGTRIPGIIYGFLVYLMYLEIAGGAVNEHFRLFPINIHDGGIIGYICVFLLRKFFGFIGIKIILIASVFISLLLIFNVTLLEATSFVGKVVYDLIQIASSLIKKYADTSVPVEEKVAT